MPNLIEAVMDTAVVTMILLNLKDRFQKQVSDKLVYFISTSLSGIYVITQELKIHNLGGNNVYDFNDLIASIIGLSFTLGTFIVFGFRENSIDEMKVAD